MNLFSQMNDYEHEQVVFFQDRATELKAIIAIHNTKLGPALGGTRFLDYQSEEEALYDVLRLSRGMSLKNAAAGLPLGGGKAVILGNPKQLKSEAFFKAYGNFLNRLAGIYYTAEDVNTNEHDMDTIHTVTDYVVGLSNKSGNPSPITARGIYQGIKAAIYHTYNESHLKGIRVAISGLGSVGYEVASYLHKEGAELLVADINQTQVEKAVAEFNAKAIDPDKILYESCDLLAPCALGAIINRTNATQLNCKIIAGAANNILVDRETGDILNQRKILYVPDYIINAGGVINAGSEITGDDQNKINERVDNIYNTVIEVIEKAEREQISTYDAADAIAWGIINQVK